MILNKAQADQLPFLHEAMDNIGATGPTASKVLGNWLADHEGRIIGNCKLARLRKGKHASRWYVTDQ